MHQKTKDIYKPQCLRNITSAHLGYYAQAYITMLMTNHGFKMIVMVMMMVGGVVVSICLIYIALFAISLFK